MNKIAVYTCLLNKYDLLLDPLYIEDNCDYFCFTDIKIKSKIWQSIEFPAINYDDTRICRYCKLHPFDLIKGYDFYVWHDAHCQLKSSIKDILNNNFSMFLHAEIKYLYHEVELIKSLKKDDPEILDKQYNFYINQGLPLNFNLFETTFMVMNNSKDNKDFFKLWWEEIALFSKRDQVSLTYLLWKYNCKVNIIKPGTVYFNKYFNRRKHVKEMIEEIKFI